MKNVLTKFGLSDAHGTIYKIKPGRYNLRRERDGQGESGQFLISIDPTNPENKVENAIVIGSVVRIENFGRWWMTTPVKSVTKAYKNGKKIIFKTRNSTYTLESK